jgi:hypothetical protein
LFDQILAQEIVNPSQSTDSHANSKLMDHPHIWQGPLVGQMGKSSPAALFR